MTQAKKWEALAREGKKRDRLGQYATCEDCGASDPRTLQQVRHNRKDDTSDRVRCAECRLMAQGKAPTERHHLAGRANGPATIPIPANDHAVLSDLQLAWPRETLRNPDGSPLLKAAASLRGWLDVLWLILEHTVGWIPDSLERLDGALRVHVGPRWWESLGWEGR